MKYRKDFVTNSSSSSFIVQKANLTEDQIYKIRNHLEYAKMKKWKDNDWFDWSDWDKWSITETEDEIKLFTIVDNFDMEWFLNKIKVPKTEYEQDTY